MTPPPPIPPLSPPPPPPPPPADVAAGGQLPLFLAGQALAAVRAGDQPVRAGRGGRAAGVVDEHVAAAQLAVEVEVEDHEARSEEHTAELQSLAYLVCRLLLE